MTRQHTTTLRELRRDIVAAACMLGVVTFGALLWHLLLGG
jgi:hypothetical protein